MEAAAHPWPALGALLLRDGALSVDQLEQALREKETSGKRLGEILVDLGFVTPTQVSRVLAEQHELSGVAIHHRIGRVEIGEPSVVIAVSSPHRAAALTACKEAIDTLKETVPLWKKEVYEGGEEWIGQGS